MADESWDIKAYVDPKSLEQSTWALLDQFQRFDRRYNMADLGELHRAFTETITALEKALHKGNLDNLITEAITAVNIFDITNKQGSIDNFSDLGPDLRKAVNGVRARLNGKIKLTVYG